MSSGGTGPLPFRLNDFLSGSYYAIAIIVVLLGLVSFALSLKWRVDDLSMHDQEHPTKGELREVAVKVEDRIHELEKRLEDLDIRGTRALSDRTTLIEQENRAQSERVQEINRRLNTLQESLNKLQSDIPVIIDRQNNNTNAIREIQQRVWSSSGGEKSPTAPRINQPQRPQ